MTTLTTYGPEMAPPTSIIDKHEETIRIRGYSVLEDVLCAAEVAKLCERLDAVYDRQLKEFGVNEMEKIQEVDVARCLLAYDEEFFKLVCHPKILAVVERLLGKYFILHLENGIINRPGKPHHQSYWHRDLPYQTFVSSKPLGVNAFFCLCDFSTKTGGTIVLPGSHRIEDLPSTEFLQANEITIDAPSGSVIFFDSMLFHRAGHNTSEIVRRGVNTVFTVGIIKQQIRLPTILQGNHMADPFLAQLLGYMSDTADDVIQWRKRREQKLAMVKK